MPALRSSKNRTHQTTPPPSPPTKDSAQVSVLSNMNGNRGRNAQPAKQRPKPTVIIDEVIEISDDDDDSPRRPSVLEELRAQVRRLKQDNENYKVQAIASNGALSAARAELSDMKAAHSKDGKKILLDATTLEDNLTCQICTIHMWSPYLLPDCGHTFCESCLDDWFNTTLAQFMTTHPTYQANQTHAQLSPYILELMRTYGMNNAHLMMRVAEIQSQSPQYTCPTCRHPVRSRPVEDFALKAIVRLAAAARGETSPQKNVPPSRGGKGKGPPIPARDPWIGFFPRRAF